MKHIAFVTQSYKADFDECRLLCESIDRFAPDIDHFIFVNDEDEAMFARLCYGRHRVARKGTLLPRGFVRVPWKIAGHHFHISPFTLPVREWIVQQICKLAVFEHIGPDYDAVFHIDSEIAFMRPFDIRRWVNSDGRYMMYGVDNTGEPSHDEYCDAAEKLLPIEKGAAETRRYNYMCQPTCFERENLTAMLTDISRRAPFGNWKLALANTYRFSEYYLYDIYTDRVLGGRNHFHIAKRPFPVVDISLFSDSASLGQAIGRATEQPEVEGICLQKRDRKNLSDTYLQFSEIEATVKRLWNGQTD